MGWANKLIGWASGNGVEVDANNQLKVALSNTPAQIGAVRLQSENDAGILTGTVYLRPPETSSDYRLRAGLDTVLLTDTFNIDSTHTNYNIWTYNNATMTALGNGAGQMVFGGTQGTAVGHYASLRSYQYFPVIGTAPLTIEATIGQFTSTLVTNEVFSFGFGVPGVNTLPTDGVYVQVSSAGIIGAAVYNGTTTQTGTLAALSALPLNSLEKLTIVVGEAEIEFWLNDILLGELPVPAANGQPFLQGSLPAFMLKQCTGTVSNTNTMRCSDITVSLMDVQTGLPRAHLQALQGLSCYQQQNGTATAGTVTTAQAVGTITTGSTPIAPTGAAGSNTAANVTGLGGWGSINAAAGAATDFIATDFGNPAGSINVTGRNLIITGITISTMNGGAAVATTPTTLLWSIAYGQTAVSLQTAEAATTHAPRRVQLGFQSAAIGTPIGGLYNDIVRTFTAPIVVRPGERLATVMKIAVGTATASQTIVYNVLFDGYYE